MFRISASLGLALALATSALGAQEKNLTLDVIYHPDRRVNFNGELPSIRWLADDHRYLQIATDRTTHLADWSVVEVASGRSAPFYDATRLEAALRGIPGLSADEAKRLSRASTYEMSPAEDAFLLNVADDLYDYRLDTGTLRRLTSTPAEEEIPFYSPEGRYVSFVREHDLHVVDVETRTERALTTDGGPEVLNGILDWVYQEEIYGRGDFQGHWWSPRGDYLAFLRLDETSVPDFTVVDHIPYHLDLEVTPYPKAGDPNPKVRLGIVSAAGGAVVWVDLDKYATTDILIVKVGWKPDGEELVYQVQNRTQTWLDLNMANPSTGASQTLFRETSPAWVNVTGDPIWLDHGFLWRSERDGWAHVYRYRDDGSLEKRLTSGGWEVRLIHGVDEENGLFYFSGTERSPLGEDVYRAGLDGSGFTRITETEGTHQADFNASFTHFVDRWSDIGTPPQLHLLKADGSQLRVIDENPVDALEEHAFSRPELLTLEARDGRPLEAFLVKPPDFDPARRYPVFLWVYGGPHAQLVQNRWGGSSHMWYQFLAQQGVLVFSVDNRIASGKGIESTWDVYRNFGELELRDLEDAVTWLKNQSYVDGSRIGLGGWSFGGFMTSYAMTHSSSFRAGIAGGSVTDWRDYDTIYTERYMSTPQENPEGYEKSSVRSAAEHLQGDLLLIHGMMDDNVHVQNTLQLAYALQKAGKSFELMLYPKSRHSVTDPALVYHMRTLMTDFLFEHLAPQAERASTP